MTIVARFIVSLHCYSLYISLKAVRYHFAISLMPPSIDTSYKPRHSMRSCQFFTYIQELAEELTCIRSRLNCADLDIACITSCLRSSSAVTYSQTHQPS